MPAISPRKNQPVTPGEVRPILLSLAEEKYKHFSASLLPGVDSILGVRLPLLRKLAGRILKSDWEGFLRETKGEYFEETMLKGFVLAQCPISPEERILRLKEFLPEIQNWSICDSVCASVKEASRYPDTYLPFLRECLSSGEEFTLRFGLIMLMDHFLHGRLSSLYSGGCRFCPSSGILCQNGRRMGLSYLLREKPPADPCIFQK